MITKYIFSLVVFLVLDYFFSKLYKIAFTLHHVIITLIGSLLFAILLWFISEKFIEDFVRLTSMSLLAEIILYFVVIKYKLLEER